MRKQILRSGAMVLVAAITGFTMLVVLPTQAEAKTKGHVDQFCKNGDSASKYEYSLRYKGKTSYKAGYAKLFISAGGWYGVKVYRGTSDVNANTKHDKTPRKMGVKVYRYSEKTRKKKLISQESGTFRYEVGCAMLTLNRGDCIYTKAWVYVGKKKYKWNGSFTCRR